jgi:hypothetical protein
MNKIVAYSKIKLLYFAKAGIMIPLSILFQQTLYSAFPVSKWHSSPAGGLDRIIYTAIS